MMVENYSLGQVLTAFESLKEEKWVEKLLDKVKNKMFWWELNDENIEEFKRFVRKFYSFYYLMKDKFSEVYRKNSGERYFEHLREVVNNVIDLPTPNIDKVLLALAHDSIEDIEDINFDFLKIIIWEKMHYLFKL